MVELSRREKEKLTHEADIVAAAENVFSKKGFEGASIDEIAETAQFTRRTVYQYFQTKEELYFSVAIKGFHRLLVYLESGFEAENTGFQKIRRAGSAFYRFYLDFPDAIRLMNYAGYIKETAKNGPRFQGFQEINAKIFMKLAEVIEKGQSDGSVRNDQPASELAFSLAFLINSFFHELSTNGKSFSSFCKLGEEHFVRSTLDLIFLSIKG